ncbi:flagellar hook-basal body complex protein FliE [Ciceribacter sp. L1K22]|uniref:flagellar hook-basal body complex protein FliE n=1 Tax=Ciceribacter sp. L1K22 TaxID=2820275 RepID=UPI001ABE492C|nr:flagellar hook-basal body complex protein FliE [Ciceribacter sp. L1K22]MBO3758370.1 flagellar hook-basal body complex protein FliE [Ciceribacter sp. L1K22]
MIDTVQNVGSLSLTGGLGSITDDMSTTTSLTPSVTPGMQTGGSFAQVLGDMATDAMNNVKQAEFMSFEGIKGTANTREVVDAVLAAEQSLQTAIAFRDKIVNAYLEITKMQI